MHIIYSEMWEACRWNDDYKYHAPMAICNGKRVFAGEIVVYCTDVDGQRVEGIAKVMKIFYNDEVINSINV